MWKKEIIANRNIQCQYLTVVLMDAVLTTVILKGQNLDC
jgi:hypothetical protein